ncbi:hypothetical protein KQI42_01720 [Tissierella sp. MSJ-40]|uniref:Uncharacterized protein n=1 Tax=Tissierella simiarum TaxID=2841534 RepID=A0ABS6E370_9FIRM|nr:hypothetical protein [Tissierella simiarum]MBU5436704.1 hypothetical protein [Tissierella simiarum]
MLLSRTKKLFIIFGLSLVLFMQFGSMSVFATISDRVSVNDGGSGSGGSSGGGEKCYEYVIN